MACMGRGYQFMTHMRIKNFPQFVGRTVMVQDNDVENSIRIVNRILAQEGMVKHYRLTRRYEKPFLMRRRVNYEKAKAIYNEDMDRKIKFIMRKNRLEPWVGAT